MTLADILASEQPADLVTLRGLVLAFDESLAQRLINVQAWYGDPRHVPTPIALADGRWMLSADVLTECQPGGIVWGGFSHLDAGRFNEIEVLPLAEVEIAEPQPQGLVAEERPEPPAN